MDALFLISRIMFGSIFILPGLRLHLLGRAQGIQLAKAKGAPSPEFMVPFAGVALVAGGLSVALGIWADIGALILCAYLLAVTPIVHSFWKETDPWQRQLESGNFAKNIGLAGAALILFYALNQLQSGAGLLITDPLIHLL
jgi:uncharacterized membrane protein YphA (DoxX/SURF4 family)